MIMGINWNFGVPAIIVLVLLLIFVSKIDSIAEKDSKFWNFIGGIGCFAIIILFLIQFVFGWYNFFSNDRKEVPDDHKEIFQRR